MDGGGRGGVRVSRDNFWTETYHEIDGNKEYMYCEPTKIN